MYARRVLTNFPNIGTSYCRDHGNPSCRPLRSWKTQQKPQRGRVCLLQQGARSHTCLRGNFSHINEDWRRQALYASQILEICVYYLTKICLLFILSRLATSKRLQQTFGFSMLVLTLWTVAAIISQAVQCPPPQPWNVLSHECHNLVCANTHLDWSTLLIPYTRTPSILHMTLSTSSLTSLSFPSLSYFCGMSRLKEARN